MREEPEGFEIFWCEWRKTKRHTDGRGKCRKEYMRQIKEGATPEDLLLAAKWHIRNTKDLAFIPLAASWLNSEAWVEEAEKERAMQASVQERATNVVQIKPVSNYKPKFLQEYEAQKREG
jgi:hypothetical protein